MGGRSAPIDTLECRGIESRGMASDVVAGQLDLLLLSAVRANPSHGYVIIEELHRKSQGAFRLSEGTVYPALHRLEKDGLLRSKWQREGRRRRRVYEITPWGRKALGERTREWRLLSAALEAVLEG